MPPATLVRAAFPVSFPTMMSCLGPQALFQTPIISTGIGSGLLPENTVQATPVMPGVKASSGKISTGPAFGGSVTFATEPQSWGIRQQTVNTKGAKALMSIDNNPLPEPD